MGMYTEVFFRAEVSMEAARMMNEVYIWGDLGPSDTPDHPFFHAPRFAQVFSGASAHFPGRSRFSLTLAVDDAFAKFGPDAESWAIVEFRSSLKNYDQEIELFFDWAKPHVRTSGGGGLRDFIGYSLYEWGDAPILYFKED